MRTLLALSLAVMVTVGACGEDDEMMVLTDADSGSDIAVEQGERFELHLEANPSTGYAWEIDAMSTPDLVELRALARDSTRP